MSVPADLDPPAISPGKPSSIVLELLLIVGWLVLLLCGFYALIDYDLRPTASGHAEATWPARASLERALQGWTLVVFLHPRCACSQATVSELARVLDQAQATVTTFVYFVKPSGAPADWERGGLRRTVSALPGVRVMIDPEGSEAARFGAESSGQTLLYDADGRLTFAGGLTAVRGHYGENPASDRLIAIINSDHQATASVDVFGCPLTDLPRTAFPETQR
jgi:hypothetical protein